MSYLDNNQLTAEQKIKITRYHSEEIKLILFICASNLCDYDQDDLVIFAECIEGRIEVLFEANYLQQQQLLKFLKIDMTVLLYFKKLQEYLLSLYGSRWSKKMKEKQIWEKANALANQILKELNIDYVEPIIYMEDENHLNVDWT